MATGGGEIERDRQAERLRATYRGYAGSPAKQRSWSARNRGNAAIRAELLDAVLTVAAEPLAAGAAVLDVGCGGGWLLAALAAGGVDAERLHGIDLIGERVAAAGQRVPGADVRLADARALPFGEPSFGLVTMLTTLSSLPGEDEVRETLIEARRILAPGGTVLVYEPRLGNPFNRATNRVSLATLESCLGPADRRRALTGFPPLARRLGPLAERLYPALSTLASTHRLTAHAPAHALRRHG